MNQPSLQREIFHNPATPNRRSELTVYLKPVIMHINIWLISISSIIFLSQKPDRFKLAPEMDTYVSDFLQGCQDPDKQLAVMVGFSSLTNQGYPVVPSVWRVVQHLEPAALQHYVEWLKKMFLQPQLDKLLDFSTRKQKDSQEGREQWVNTPVVCLAACWSVWESQSPVWSGDAEKGRRRCGNWIIVTVDFPSSGKRIPYSAWGSGLFPGSLQSLTTTKWRGRRISSWMWPGKTCLQLSNVKVSTFAEEKAVSWCCFCSRFVFFHAFFSAKKASADIPETEGKLSVPLDEKTRGVLVNSFFGWEMTLEEVNKKPSMRDCIESKKRVEQSQPSQLWRQQLSSMAQRNKLYEALASQIVLV